MSIKKRGFLYIVSFNTGLLKVGRSYCNPQSRITSHIATAKIGGAEFSESYVAESVSVAQDELRLVSMLSLSDGVQQIGREWFIGLSIEKVKAMMDCIIQDSLQNFDPDFEKDKEKKRDDRFAESLNALRHKKDVSEHGHEWMACYPFAKALANRINSHEDTPELFSSKVGDSDVNLAELGLWILLYTSPIDYWLEYAIASEDHPGDVLHSAEKAVKEMLSENGMI